MLRGCTNAPTEHKSDIVNATSIDDGKVLVFGAGKWTVMTMVAKVYLEPNALQ